MEVYGNHRNHVNECIDIIRTIQDPEKPCTLEELSVVDEDLVTVTGKPPPLDL